MTDPKVFLKAHVAPKYTNFEWVRAPKYFFGSNFPKRPKNAVCIKFCQNIVLIVI